MMRHGRAVILCGFPLGETNARSWIPDRVTLLAIRGEAELQGVGTEHATSDAQAIETIAVGFARVECARAILSGWRRETTFPGIIETKLLRIEPIGSIGMPMAIFPDLTLRGELR